MQHRYPNKHWTSKRHITKAKQDTKKRKIFVTKKRVLDFYVTPILLYGTRCWTSSLRRRKYRGSRNLVLQQDSENSMEKRLKNKKRPLIFKMKKTQLKILGHINNEGVKILAVTEHIDVRRNRRRQRVTFLTSGTMDRYLRKRINAKSQT